LIDEAVEEMKEACTLGNFMDDIGVSLIDELRNT